MGTNTRITVSAPGRICLFGEHQDFLGLAVIAAAIDRDIHIEATRRSDSLFRLEMPDIGETDVFDGAREVAYRHSRDYLRSTTNVMRRQGLDISQGYDVTIRGTIPINAGTASSSALVIAWVRFLLATQTGEALCGQADIARYGYLSEVAEFDEPGGMMDHYASALGGVIYIDCREPIMVTPLAVELDGFVLGDSCVPKDTTATLRESRAATNEGMALLAEAIPGFDIKTTPLAEAEPFFERMRPDVRRRVRSNFINRDLCQEARAMLSSGAPDPSRLGAMLLEHQGQLRDGIGVSHPRLDALIEASMDAGALGGKLNGSGMGGCMFAYAPGRQEQVCEAIDRAGGKGYMVKVRKGVCVNPAR